MPPERSRAPRAGRISRREAGPRTGHPYVCVVCGEHRRRADAYRDHVSRHGPLELGELAEPPQEENRPPIPPPAARPPFWDWAARPGTEDAAFPPVSEMGLCPSVVLAYNKMIQFVDEVCAPQLRAIGPHTVVPHPELSRFETQMSVHSECMLGNNVRQRKFLC